MMNNWKNIWNKKCSDDDISKLNFEQLFIEMKILAGYDSHGTCSISYSSFCKEYYEMMENLSERKEITKKINSIYEIGCGAGANLLLAKRDNLTVGGVDYAEGVIKFAKKVFGDECDIIMDEAINVPIELKYDSVVSNGVFPYFPDEEYAKNVLKIMYNKSNLSLGILHIIDSEKKDELIEFNKKNIPDYSAKYKNLEKTFYSKEFFLEFARENDLDVKITPSYMANYWNNSFTYNVYMYKF